MKIKGKIALLVLERAGIRLVRDYQYPVATQHPLHLALPTLRLTLGRPLSLIQVGANDGFTNDPLQTLLAKQDFFDRALLIEPQAAYASELRKRYGSDERVTILEAAVTDEPGTALLNIPVAGTDAKKATLNKKVLERYSNLRVKQVEVSGVTPHQVLNQQGFKSVDVLQIDAEGMDFVIAKLFLEEGCKPGIINLEHRHLSREEKKSLRTLLRGSEYHFLETDLDCMAWKKDLFP